MGQHDRSELVPIEWWDACVGAHAVVRDPRLPVWIGVDASVKHDSTAIVVCAYDSGLKKVQLVWHRTFQPSPDDPLDFEDTVEKTLLDLRGRFAVREIRYDPYQLVAVAQRLKRAGLPMAEFPQTVGNLTEASSNLYDLVKGRNLTVYPDRDIRLAVARAVAVESSRAGASRRKRHRVRSMSSSLWPKLHWERCNSAGTRPGGSSTCGRVRQRAERICPPSITSRRTLRAMAAGPSRDMG
jgi:phage terminase large subunit-like protein